MKTNCPHCRYNVTVKPIRRSLLDFKGYCNKCRRVVRVSKLDQHINANGVFDVRQRGGVRI